MMKPGQAEPDGLAGQQRPTIMTGWLGGHVVAPGVGGLEAEDLAGAVDGQQGAELAYIAGQRDTGEDLPSSRSALVTATSVAATS
jgi:hypothetical protein